MTDRPPPNDARHAHEATPSQDTPAVPSPDAETCDLCGSNDLVWRNCKLHCRSCNGIVKSCADL